MTWYEDLSPCDYFHTPPDKQLPRAVGWLEQGHPYQNGKVQREVFERLKMLLANPWQCIAHRGLHHCDLCIFHGEASGCTTLFIPGDGFLYVCPQLILHYINAHQYLPPHEFCEAVMRCPDQNTMAFRRLLIANGVSGLYLGGGKPMVPPSNGGDT